MKKCTFVIDSLEKQDVSNPLNERSLIEHAKQCPDCARDMAFRSKMLKSLSSLSEPEYPAHLHSAIIERVYSQAEPPPKSLWSFAASFFDSVLAPLELASVACALVAVFFLMQADNGAGLNEMQIKKYSSAQKITSATRIYNPSAAPVYKPSTASIYKLSAAPVYNPSAMPVCKPLTAPVYNPSAAPIYKLSAAPVYKLSKQTLPAKQFKAPKSEAKASDALKPASAADVEQFLTKLKHFNEQRPEERRAQNVFSPELRLVNTLSQE